MMDRENFQEIDDSYKEILIKKKSNSFKNVISKTKQVLTDSIDDEFLRKFKILKETPEKLQLDENLPKLRLNNEMACNNCFLKKDYLLEESEDELQNSKEKYMQIAFHYKVMCNVS